MFARRMVLFGVKPHLSTHQVKKSWRLYEPTASSLFCSIMSSRMGRSSGVTGQSSTSNLWEKRTALLQGFELDPSNLGGWSLDKHHILNVKSGMWETSLTI